ncbi:MAG: c-type cytochrome biogenesis protein CcmI [Betaproteobacteria bacterium]|nr:c-type cytochrome biogenesis protein CcmI [Betaproteobacteria bacterium]
MTQFFIIAAVLLVVALAWIIVPLVRPARRASQDVAGTNLGILRDQLAELDADRAAGTLSPAQYEEARQEIERRVLDEASVGRAASTVTINGRWMATGVGAMFAVAAILLYAQFGTPDGLAPQARSHGGNLSNDEINDLIAKRAARLDEKPSEEGFVLLGRSYYAQQRFAEAVRAFERAGPAALQDADILADYADALGATNRDLSGKPMELVRLAIALDPKHDKSLALAGTDAFQRKDYGGAIKFWERIGSDPAFAQSIAASIQEAREFGSIKTAAKTGTPDKVLDKAPVAASITGTVRLAPALAGKANREDTVFIFARHAEGPRMPLAIVKKQVKDLPYTFTLDDSQTMAPTMTLSGASAVVVGARISKTGDATPKSGDLQGFSGTVKVGASGIAVLIDSTVP